MPRRHPFSADIRERTIALVTAGMDSSTAEVITGVSARTVRRWTSASAVGRGRDDRAAMASRGRRRLVNTAILEDLRLLVLSAPSLYLDEIATWLAVHHDLPLSVTTIHEYLKCIGLTYKKLRKTAARRDELTREQWKAHIFSKFSAEQLVFADESSKDHRTTLRRYGRAMAGERAVEMASLNRGVRYSILPALSLNGLLTVRVVRGSVNSLGFYDWVVSDLVRTSSYESLMGSIALMYIQLPRMNPFPGPNSVLIIDNCRTHKSAAVREAIHAAGEHVCFRLIGTSHEPKFYRLSSYLSSNILTGLESD